MEHYRSVFNGATIVEDANMRLAEKKIRVSGSSLFFQTNKAEIVRDFLSFFSPFKGISIFAPYLDNTEREEY